MGVRIGFAILLDDESHNFARKIELDLCKKFNLCWGLKQSPHITIKRPFDIDKIEPFLNYIEDLTQNFHPFEIEIDGFGYFEGEKNVIFLDVKESPKLKEIQMKILSDLKNNFNIQPYDIELNGWKFHATLATEDVCKEKLVKAKEYLKQFKPKFKFLAKTIGVFYYLGKEVGWIIIRRVNLKRDNN